MGHKILSTRNVQNDLSRVIRYGSLMKATSPVFQMMYGKSMVNSTITMSRTDSFPKKKLSQKMRRITTSSQHFLVPDQVPHI